MRWLGRELDPDGVPFRLPVAYWTEALSRILGAIEGAPQSDSDAIEARVEGWLRATLRFAKPGAIPVFQAGHEAEIHPDIFRRWAKRLGDPGIDTILDWWFPAKARGRHAPPPLPSDARPDRTLAVLRPNWLVNGDLIAVDHRVPGNTCLFELFGMGRSWLGTHWKSPTSEAKISKAKPVRWESKGSADHFEWSFRIGQAKVIRSAVLLRGRRLAILGEQWDGPGDPGEYRIGLAAWVEGSPLAETRCLQILPHGLRGSARVYPIGLPAAPYETERGSLRALDREIVLRQPMAPGQRRIWRPLVVSWDAKRNRQPVHWRTLTVTERSRECPPGTAFAARITWGRNDTLLVYRSLAKPGLRAFLGHQTKASFLVALFDREGEVEPLVKVEPETV